MAERAHPRHRLASFVASFLVVAGLIPFASPVMADNSTQTLPFSQDWSNTGLITTIDDWSGVPGVVGYRGDGLTAATAVDPQTVLADGSATPADVNVNQTTPNTFTTGGIAEFEIADPVVAFQGSGTADAPHLVISIATTGLSNVSVAYNLRDIDGSADNAVQPVALQYRVGSSGDFTNVAAGFVADATTGPSLATLVTAINAGLPAAANDQALVQVRILTTDAAGSDELVGVDDISITASAEDLAPSVASTAPADGATGIALNTQPSITFSEPVAVDGPGVSLSCTTQGSKAATLAGGPSVYTLTTTPFLAGDHCTIAILASAVTDTDTNDPPDTMAANFSASFDIVGATPTGVVISEVYGGGGNSGATIKNDFIELYNSTAGSVNLTGWSVQYASSAGTTWQVTALTGSIAPGKNYLVQEAPGAGGTVDLPVPDATGTIAMSATSGKVALVSTTSALTGSCPTANVVDFVGFGIANCFEGAGAAPQLSNSTSAQRIGGGATDTNRNNLDFVTGAPDPRAAEKAPAVRSTTPANGAMDVALTANLSITFTEPVTATDASFTISCSLSGSHSATLSGGPTTYSLDPATNFASDEACTLTVLAANVTDQDADDPPDNLAADVVISFTTIDAAVCGDPGLTLISSIQGSGASSPLAGSRVSIEAVVVGDYQGAGSFGGYFVQEEDADADADPATSEGLFVFNTSTDVNVGDHLRIKGTVTEFGGLTEISPASRVQICSTGNALSTPTPVTFPVTSIGDFERLEGMLVSMSQELTVTEVFNLGRFGEVSLSAAGRLANPTNVVAPGAPANDLQDLNDRSRIVLDDGNGLQNIDPTLYPQGGLSAANTLRVGDSLPSLTGVLDFRFSLYRVQPTGPISFNHTNPRPVAPEPVGGNLQVASFNVLNYFNGDGAGGGFPTARGAETLFELGRQREKEVAAITALDADVVGLMELENDDPTTEYAAIEDLVDALNAATAPGTYDFINTGIVGTDEIRVALIYKPGVVTPVGDYAIIDSTVDPAFIDTLNRPSIAQTFALNSTGAQVTIVVNHLKSKGSDCNAVGDPDTGDGQGNCNLTRTAAATALATWLATDPTGAGDADYLIIGDLNSYAMEDPITALKNAGYVDTLREFIGSGAYSYVFQGQSGYLDHALASSHLAAQVTGVAEWHINPDEPTVLDYNTNFKTANQVTTFYAPDAYRSSDHDPVIVGLDLNAPPTVDAGGPYAVIEGGSVIVSATGSDPDGDTLTYAWDLDDNGSFETIGQSATFSAAGLQAPLSLTIRVRVSDGDLTATDAATVNVIWDFAGFFGPVTASPVVNIANAGAAVPIKFSLAGDQGLAVLATGYPRSAAYACGSTPPSDATTPTKTTSDGFTFDPATGLYTYTWKTEKSWAKSCRVFVLKLADGTYHYALFNFTK